MKTGKFILHFNTPELTQKLCSVIPDAIVVDNGSDDDKRYKGPNRFIFIDKNLGFTAGWNLVIKYYYDACDAFWLMNSDIEITSEHVMMAEKLMEQGYDMLTPSYNSWMHFLQNKKSGKVREVPMIEFTAPIISRNAFQKIGLFDERFVRGYGVEFDFCYRMRLDGLKMWVDDLTRFNHLGQQTINKHEGINEYAKIADEELRKGLEDKYGKEWRTILFNGTGIKCNY